MGVNQSAVNISGMLGAAVMPPLAVAFGWHAGFVFAAALALVVCGVALVLYRDPTRAEALAVTADAPRRPPRSPSWRSTRGCRP